MFHVEQTQVRRSVPRETSSPEEDALAKTVAVVNQKGGVGKTTTAVNLACGLALAEKRTLLVDLDPQGNATTGLGVDKAGLQRTVYHVLLEDVPITEVVVPAI